MNRYYCLIPMFLLCCVFFGKAQTNAVQRLDTVVLSDPKLVQFSEGFKLQTLSDSIINNNTSLTDVLRFNTPIYFKENGYGMVSSPSFRGTNASQTAVIWNGIPINSALNGQTDFNTITPQAYDNITVRSGGGSVPYGSGAIGGSIHLNNEMTFKEFSKTDLKLLYGSFGTIEGNLKNRMATKSSYADVQVSFISSENDYEYLETNQKNENGEFLRFNTNANIGFKRKHHLFTWNTNFFLGKRNFSNSITAVSRSRYQDATTRNLLSWKTFGKNYESTLKVAHLFEQYRYFPIKEKNEYDEGNAHSFISDYAFDYKMQEDMKLSVNVNYTRIEGDGSNIGANTRNTLSAFLLFHHQVTDAFSYGANIRQSFLTDFDNPLLFAADASYKVAEWYTLKVNGSKNYRVPTFNDLYWNAGGNDALQPESSVQGELSNVFYFGKLQLEATVYYIDSSNLIQWRPNASGVWMPENVSEVENYGGEFSATYKTNFQQHQFSLHANYAYTKAVNVEKNKQQLYVPFHKATGLFNYQFKRFQLDYQTYYNGKVFTTTDNKGEVASYSIANIHASYALGSASNVTTTIGVHAYNIFNTYYENVAYRPMPNRNIQTFINFKF